jgi:hypothetical protein
MRNLQYEIRICQKSHNTVTITVYVWTVVRILMKQTLSFAQENIKTTTLKSSIIMAENGPRLNFHIGNVSQDTSVL